MKKFYQKFKETVVHSKFGLASAIAGAALVLPCISHAALSTEESAMVTTVTTKLADLVTAVASIATANLGLIAAMVVAGLIIMYMKSAGR
ncbi:MAG TPA: hypothetical protein VLS45_01490 [Methylomicrobium sp.]|nr:hypothetical protein [Methylomicrobium sp.]